MENFIKASPADRFLALLIDGLVSYVPVLLFLAVSSNLSGLGYLVSIAYLFTKDALPFLNGQSIGKRAIGIKVILSDTGEMITNNYKAAILLRQLPTMIPILNIVDAIMVFSSNGLRLGDQWAETRVVKV